MESHKGINGQQVLHVDLGWDDYINFTIEDSQKSELSEVELDRPTIVKMVDQLQVWICKGLSPQQLDRNFRENLWKLGLSVRAYNALDRCIIHQHRHPAFYDVENGHIFDFDIWCEKVVHDEFFVQEIKGVRMFGKQCLDELTDKCKVYLGTP